MRYLVTGVCGVIGSLFARQMQSLGHEVVGFDNGKAPRHDYTQGALGLAGVEVYRKDLRCSEFRGELKKCDRVLHAAASTGIPYSAEEPAEDWDLNVEATRALLMMMRAARRPMVVLSSVKPLVPAPNGQVGFYSRTFCEEPYAASKLAQSSICQAYAKSYDMPIAIFRCSNLYGPAPCHGPRHGWATWLAIAAAIGLPFEIQGTGKQQRDLLYYTDLNDAILRAFDWVTVDQPRFGETFVIGGGVPLSVNKAVSELERYSEIKKTSGPPRKNDDDIVFAENFNVSSKLGWNPTVDFREGLKSVYDWARSDVAGLRRVYRNVK